MEIKILGSISPYCKEDKNCPGYLVTEGSSKVLLDCGNGITRNLKLPEDLENLNIIISHLHKDHYGDLLSLGYATYVFHNLGYLPNRVKVYIPEADMRNVTEDYKDADGWGASHMVKKPILDYVFLQEFGPEQFFEFIPYNEKTKLEIGNMKIEFSKNPHQVNTYSTKVVDKDKTFVYSGDTGYQGNSLVRLAEEADILLCEATFLRGQTRLSDNHLYAYEAARIAKEANVRKLILTHFFPEIDKEQYVQEARTIFENTAAAEEGKVLKLGGIK